MIISEMQRKLATWAATDPSLRIQRLLRLITQPEWLAEAARITLSSKGAHTPGVDGVNKTMLQARLAVELQILRDELLSGHYQPLPARRVYIPKSNGKLRPLGIPALRDRIVQRAMLMAMEPIWESDFHTLSYGFRPERSVHHAIRTVKLQLTDCGDRCCKPVLSNSILVLSVPWKYFPVPECTSGNGIWSCAHAGRRF